jgi:hypothetical protein
MVGMNAGQFMNTANNVGVGFAALQGGTSINFTGNSNAALGYQAGQYLNASSSVAIGYAAMRGQSGSTLTGNNSVAVGYFAGSYMSAASNVAVGYQALQGSATTALTGTNNVAIGYIAGSSITTGSNNIFVGSTAGGAITGSYQIGLGYGVIPTASNLGAWGGNANATRTDQGIGTYTPLARTHIETLAAANKGLYIAGQPSQTANLLQIDATTSGTNLVTITGIGSVGLGTANPTQLLHIQGNARLTGSLYDVNNLPGTQIGVVSQVLTSTGTGVTWAPVKRSLVTQLLTAYTPSASGIDSGMFIVPQDPNDGSSTMNFTFKRANVRVETPSSGISTINIVKYIGVGSALGLQTAILSSNILLTGASTYEGFSTSFATGFTTCASTDKLAVNFVGYSTFHTNFTVELIMRET